MNTVVVSADNPIVKIQPYLDSIFTVHWLIGNRCNFSCSYCPDKWHSKISVDKTFDDLCSAWKRIVELNSDRPFLTYDISFMGGEPTLNKDFLPFVKWLHFNYNSVLVNLGVISNGTANIKYYKELVKYCNWITFSTHSEFMNEVKFFNTVAEIDLCGKLTGCKICVNIMDEPWHTDRNLEYQKFLTDRNINNYIHPINDFPDKKPPYPIKQTNKINFYDYRNNKR
jgi:organic radical activating enzyme